MLAASANAFNPRRDDPGRRELMLGEVDDAVAAARWVAAAT